MMRKNVKTIICSVFLFCWLLPAVFASIPASALKTLLRETVDAAAKCSGRTLSPALRTNFEKTLEKFAVQYGDDVFRIVREGGLETIEQGTKHGDDFWRFCKHASPGAVRSFALHTDEFLPIVKRIGPEFLELESKVPGLGRRIVEHYGDDAVRILKDAPSEDLTRLAGLAEKADSQATRKLLLEKYGEHGSSLLNKLKPGQILAGGLSAAAILAACEIGSSVKEKLEKEPEALERFIIQPFWRFISLISVIVLLPFLCKGIISAIAFAFRFFRKKKGD